MSTPHHHYHHHHPRTPLCPPDSKLQTPETTSPGEIQSPARPDANPRSTTSTLVEQWSVSPYSVLLFTLVFLSVAPTPAPPACRVTHVAASRSASATVRVIRLVMPCFVSSSCAWRVTLGHIELLRKLESLWSGCNPSSQSCFSHVPNPIPESDLECWSCSP
jgi:hypothetical protein